MIAVLIPAIAGAGPAQGRGAQPAGDPALDCGDLFYDDGGAEDAIFFGGGNAGDPRYFMGVRFVLADFDLAPGTVDLTGFCVSNQLDFSGQGGPWPNEVFVFPDNGGLPDVDNPLRQATMWTGDGSGAYEAEFVAPLRLDSPVFWLMVRGDPQHTGQDFNLESDQSSEPAGRSWITDRGLPFIFMTEQNLMLRAVVQPAGETDPVAVPILGTTATWLLALLAGLVAAAGLRIRSRVQRGP